MVQQRAVVSLSGGIGQAGDPIDFGDGTPVLVQVTETTNMHEKPEYEMNCFISPEMGPLAVARAESTQQPKGLVTYRYGELPIKGLVRPPEWIGPVARLE